MDEKNTGHKTYLVNLLQNPSTRILYWKIINGPVDHREMQKKKKCGSRVGRHKVIYIQSSYGNIRRKKTQSVWN
jgi:hypothetical protein